MASDTRVDPDWVSVSAVSSVLTAFFFMGMRTIAEEAGSGVQHGKSFILLGGVQMMMMMPL